MAKNVNIKEIIPIILDFLSDCFKYLKAYPKPKGARKKLTKYMRICFKIEVSARLNFKEYPQLGQKLAISETSALHFGHCF